MRWNDLFGGSEGFFLVTSGETNAPKNFPFFFPINNSSFAAKPHVVIRAREGQILPLFNTT